MRDLNLLFNFAQSPLFFLKYKAGNFINLFLTSSRQKFKSPKSDPSDTNYFLPDVPRVFIPNEDVLPGAHDDGATAGVVHARPVRGRYSHHIPEGNIHGLLHAPRFHVAKLRQQFVKVSATLEELLLLAVYIGTPLGHLGHYNIRERQRRELR